MKRICSVVPKIALVVAVVFVASAQSLGQDSGLLMLSKNFNGIVTRSAVEIGLTANADCDQTKTFIPENSKLVTQNFVLSADSNGVGTFSGTAYIITPDGRVVLSGTLKGTVGINTRCGTNRSCRQPWHLEGLFESTPSSMERVVIRAANRKILPMMLNFSGDLNSQSTGSVQIYQGRLDGLVPALPAEVDRVVIGNDKPSYLLNEVIFASVVNDSTETIQIWDNRSFCSVFQLQVLDGNQWNDTAFCRFKNASLPINLAPGEKFSVQLDPSQTIEPLKEGVYRLALTFKFVSGNIPLSDTFVNYTPQFRLAAQAPSNQVILNTNKSGYVEQEAVFLRVNNDTAQNVVVYDHQSFCSFVTLQKQQGGNWVNLFECLLATPSKPVKIASREEIELKLPTDEVATKLTQGIYRLQTTYWNLDANGNPVGNPSNIYSATFSVTGK